MTVEAGIREILSRCLLLPLQTPSVRGYTGEHEVKRETESGAACEPPYFWWPPLVSGGNKWHFLIFPLDRARPRLEETCWLTETNRAEMINGHLQNLNASEDWRSACPTSLVASLKMLNSFWQWIAENLPHKNNFYYFWFLLLAAFHFVLWSCS